ncbi:MAG: hypothetical protein QOF78_712 [Phycisphaerales bacterium]|jgi:hypothetical protein|nr:hypothetical protein [Phycisphaerales bacterium]MEA2735104.1 hypothetical protein [Humisphaera sp.]
MADENDLTVEATSTSGNEDLSQEIARSIPRKGQEQVTCRRVSGHHYRCNWWSLHDTGAYDNPGMTASLVTTSRICKSQFLHVTKVAGNLKIKELTR